MVKTAGKRASKKRAGKLGADLEDRIFETLLQVMSDSESDSVRVAAAKALMDRILREHAEKQAKNEDEGGDDEERLALVAEIRAALAKVAEAKSGGDGGADAVDRDGEASPVDAQG